MVEYTVEFKQYPDSAFDIWSVHKSKTRAYQDADKLMRDGVAEVRISIERV